jgi:hypothetical protein
VEVGKGENVGKVCGKEEVRDTVKWMIRLKEEEREGWVVFVEEEE